ncbi:hypothetical protein LIER_09814 [Lithospermum erythrorhizon]|uniref:Uncharacterized protein n=1 Tax=Lithospermum erythrorhizon TaxID=34254 RepID=A0AAV3PIE2_LITER
MCLYVKECPYAKVASPEPHLESPVTRSPDDESSSDDESSLSAKSPIPKVTIGNLVVSKIMPIDDDVRTSAPIKGTFPLLFVLSSSLISPKFSLYVHTSLNCSLVELTIPPSLNLLLLITRFTQRYVTLNC